MTKNHDLFGEVVQWTSLLGEIVQYTSPLGGYTMASQDFLTLKGPRIFQWKIDQNYPLLKNTLVIIFSTTYYCSPGAGSAKK
jgi:hypothetical protein